MSTKWISLPYKYENTRKVSYKSMFKMAGRVSIFTVCLFVLFLSCQKEETSIFIHEELEFYFTEFSAEALKRGIQVDYESTRIEGVFQNTEIQNVIGQCHHKTETPNQVVIDPGFWESAGHLDKEFIVFHELGHCYLKRSHLDNIDEMGICISIMHSGQVCEDNYNNATREEYLDELFSY